MFAEELPDRHLAANEVDPVIFGQENASVLRQLDGLGCDDGRRVIDHDIPLYTDRLTGIVVRAAQIIPEQALRHVGQSSIGKERRLSEYLDFIIVPVIFPLRNPFVVQAGVCDLMDRRRDGLYFAHPFIQHDLLLAAAEVSIRSIHQRFNRDRHGRTFLERFHEHGIPLHIAGEIAHDAGQRFTVRLAHIEYGNRTIAGNLDLHFFLEHFTIRAAHGQFGLRIELFLFFADGIGRRRENPDAALASVDMALELIAPFVESGYQRSVRLLHEDEHGVVYGIPVKTGHGFQVLPVLFAFKQLLDAALDAFYNFFQPILLIVFCHKNLLSRSKHEKAPLHSSK